jgi:hypothetical protein
MEWNGMDCIYVAQDRNKWRDFLNTAIKYWEILEKLSDWGLPKKDSVPWN